MRVTRDHASIGVPFTYTVTVANSGPVGATGVVLTVNLPAHFTISLISPSQGSCGNSGGTVTCPLGAIASSSSSIIEIQAVSDTGPVFTTTAYVSSDQSDPATGDNTVMMWMRVGEWPVDLPAISLYGLLLLASLLAAAVYINRRRNLSSSSR